MHCDDKRTLYVLKEEIKKQWALLQDSDFSDQKILRELNNAITEYLE